jgi:hypothetical protein
MKESNDDQVFKWAQYVKKHPKEWKKHLVPFLDSQIIIANNFYKRLCKTKEGREKIKKLTLLKIKSESYV